MNLETLTLQVMVGMIFGFAFIVIFCAWRHTKYEDILKQGKGYQVPTFEESWFAMSKGFQSVAIFAVVIVSILWLLT